eukprot:15987406-Heterocapsa_arctica.AAC.1
MPSSSRCGARARTVADASQTSLALGGSSRFNLMPSIISQRMLITSSTTARVLKVPGAVRLLTLLLVDAFHQSSSTTSSSLPSQARCPCRAPTPPSMMSGGPVRGLLDAPPWAGRSWTYTR